MSLVNSIAAFIERWVGAVSEVALAFLGILICIFVVLAVWDRKVHVMTATLIAIVGLLLVFHQPIYLVISNMQGEMRLRVFIISTSVLFLLLAGLAFSKDVFTFRLAALWFTSLIPVVIAGLSANVQNSLGNLFGLHNYYAIFAALLWICLAMIFYFSLVVSNLQTRLRKLEKRFVTSDVKSAADITELRKDPETRVVGRLRSLKEFFTSSEHATRKIRGMQIGAPVFILFVFCSVLTTGFLTPQPMIGDEVTHYYMLKKQAVDLSEPNFYAHIPIASGDEEVRRYPHSFLWHYFGALGVFLSKDSVVIVQVYHALYLLQLLMVAYLLARSRGGIENRSVLVYLLIIASLPITLIFSVSFYQDVPMAAQILTSYYLLSRKKWLWASIFMAIAIGLKITAILFLPGFLMILLIRLYNSEKLVRGVMIVICSLLILVGFTWALGKSINIYADSPFYPQEKLVSIVRVMHDKVRTVFVTNGPHEEGIHIKDQPVDRYDGIKTKENKPTIIANHPGDLRIKENFLIYGGMVLWIAILLWLFQIILSFVKPKWRSSPHVNWDIWLLGGSFVILTAYFSKSAPDARFFLPGLIFLLLPVSERLVRLPFAKIIIAVMTALSILQGGYVLAKVYNLRALSPGLIETINYLEQNPPSPKKVFMYPEGNYRFFPVHHEWYLGYRLKEFWRSDNSKRIEILNEHGIGAIVVKKNLIGMVDEKIINLGVYPVFFMHDIDNDNRFKRIFNNKDISIYTFPTL